MDYLSKEQRTETQVPSTETEIRESGIDESMKQRETSPPPVHVSSETE